MGTIVCDYEYPEFVIFFIDNAVVSIFRERVLVSFCDWSGNDGLSAGSDPDRHPFRAVLALPSTQALMRSLGSIFIIKEGVDHNQFL